jgi:hypothetical protein
MGIPMFQAHSGQVAMVQACITMTMAPLRLSSSRVLRVWVHAEVRCALSEVFPMAPTDRWQRRKWKPPVRMCLPVLMSQHGYVGQVWQAGWPDTIWVSVMRLLEQFGRDIRRCGVCAETRLFLKRKRQQYCSPACSQRVRSARWYQQHRAEALERRHQMYKRRVLKGRKGIVARRRRITSGLEEALPNRLSGFNSDCPETAESSPNCAGLHETSYLEITAVLG